MPTVYTAGRADAVRGYKAEAVCVSVSGWYLYGVLRVPLPRVRSVNGFPATTARPALILRINGYRTYTLFSLCKPSVEKLQATARSGANIPERGETPSNNSLGLVHATAQYTFYTSHSWGASAGA